MESSNPVQARRVDKPCIHILVLVIVALIAYSNSFRVPFVFDDETSITRNDVIFDLTNFLFNRSGYDSMPNRYVGYLSFALNHHFGGLNVVGYHVVNLAIHISNGILVYGLVRQTLRTPFFKERNEDRETRSEKTSFLELHSSNLVPFLAALLFICHPIQTQAVTYIVQRLTSLATLFYLAALVLHVRWSLARQAGAAFTSRSVLPFWLLSLFSALLAMKTKEIAFTLPLTVLLYDHFFFGKMTWRRLSELLPMLLTILVIPFTMLSLHKPVGQILSDVSKATIEGTDLSRWDYLCTQFSVIVTYLRLLVLPFNQNLDYDYPLNHSLTQPRAFLSLALLLAILGLGIWLWRRSSVNPRNSSLELDPYLRLASFGILWFFITLSVESSIIPISDVIFEHRIYLPSFGFFLAISGLTGACCNRWPRFAGLTAAGTAVLAIVLSFATVARNAVWASEVSIWRDSMVKSPNKARTHANLGVAYAKQELINDAISEFETAVLLAPDPANPYEFITPVPLSNMVIIYVSAGRLQQAAAACAALLRRDPGMELQLNLYQILRIQHTDDEALLLVRNACGIAPSSARQ